MRQGARKRVRYKTSATSVVPYQVYAIPVLKGPEQRDNIFMALEVVHDLHLPPHILYIFLCPAHTSA